MKKVKRGEVYYADLSPAKGSEQDGIRPVVILQNDVGNQFSPTAIIAIMSKKTRKNPLPTHVRVKATGLRYHSTVKLEHIRTIDKSRLLNFVGSLNSSQLKKIDTALAVSFGLNEVCAKHTTQNGGVDNE